MKVWDKLKSLGIDRVLTNMKDYHMPVMIVFFFVGCAIAVWRPASMTYTFVAFTGTIVGGITGHAYSPAAKDPDPKDDGTTVSTSTTVNVGS